MTFAVEPNLGARIATEDRVVVLSGLKLDQRSLRRVMWAFRPSTGHRGVARTQ